MSPKRPPSFSAQAGLLDLGKNISIARKRRRMTIKHVAEATGVTSETIRRLEKGEPGVSIGALAMALLIFGEIGRLSDLLAPPTDDIGMIISVNDLPKRVREKGKTKKSTSFPEKQNQGVHDGKYVGF